jgi:CRISPR-associated protein Cas2
VRIREKNWSPARTGTPVARKRARTFSRGGAFLTCFVLVENGECPTVAAVCTEVEVFVVVCYDVVDDRTRTRLAKLMQNYGNRVQKSVFECTVDDRVYLRMKEQIEKLIDWEEDSVRYYFLCGSCVKQVEISGWGAIREDEEVIVV